MGVSGSGKSTVGELLTRRLGARFIDGDLLHPRANITKMESGQPLNDEDRRPWLESIGQQLADAGDRSLVIACSALKKSYRDIIRGSDPSVRFVLLHGDAGLLTERTAQRRGHFMPSSLLASQLDTLELLGSDEAGFQLDITETPEDLADKAAAMLRKY